jgi:hypothetical protein
VTPPGRRRAPAIVFGGSRNGVHERPPVPGLRSRYGSGRLGREGRRRLGCGALVRLLTKTRVRRTSSGSLRVSPCATPADLPHLRWAPTPPALPRLALPFTSALSRHRGPFAPVSDRSVAAGAGRARSGNLARTSIDSYCQPLISPVYTGSRSYRSAISTPREHAASPSLVPLRGTRPRRSVHRFDFPVWGAIANRQ